MSIVGRYSGAFLNDIRLNKRRIEQTCARKGEEQTNVKTGYGGIRDVEFIVQLLQMEFGGTQPRLRTPNTLTALTRLNEANFLTDRETEALSDDYRWLRTLEHRLQLLNDRQTQTLPAPENDRERYRLARRMGYATREDFETDLQQRRRAVRGYLDRLFYDQDRRFYPTCLQKSIRSGEASPTCSTGWIPGKHRSRWERGLPMLAFTTSRTPCACCS